MAGPFKPWPFVKADLERYRRAAPRGDESRTGLTSFTLAAYCENDHKAARRRAKAGLLWAYRKIMEVSAPLLAKQVEGYEHYRTLGLLAPSVDRVLTLPLLEGMGLAAVGSPEHVLQRLASLRKSGLDRVSLVIGGGDLGAGEIVDCLHLLADRVLPELAAEPAPPVVAEPA